MKALKKILILTLVLVMALTSFACGKRSELNSSQSSTNDSSIVQPPKAPEKVERADVQTQITDNLMLVTPRDLVGMAEEEVNPLKVVFGDLMLGDVAKEALSEMLYFDYYDDGQWRLSNGTAFGVVPNAIFSYKIGGGEPLALSETQLALYGNNTVLSCFSELFATNLENLPLGEGDLAQIIGDLSKITVQDLYDLTCGDFSFFVDYLIESDVDLFIGALCEVIGSSQGVEIDSTILKQVFSGTLEMPEIEAEYILETLIPELIAGVQDEQANEFLALLYDAIIECLYEGYEPTFEEIVTSLFNSFYETEIQPIIDEYGEMTLEQVDAEQLDGILSIILPESVIEYFDNFQATLNDFVAEIEALIAGENQELMDVVGEIDFLYSLQALVNEGQISQEIYALIDALIDGTIEEPVLNTELAIDELFNMLSDLLVLYVDAILDIPNGDIFYYLSIEALEVLEDLYYGATIEDLVDSTMQLAIDDVISAINDFTDSFMKLELLDLTYDLLRGVLSGTVSELRFNSDASATILINYMHELALEIAGVYVNEVTFYELRNEYGDMTIVEFVEAFFEENSDVPFAEILKDFFTPEYV